MVISFLALLLKSLLAFFKLKSLITLFLLKVSFMTIFNAHTFDLRHYNLTDNGFMPFTFLILSVRHILTYPYPLNILKERKSTKKKERTPNVDNDALWKAWIIQTPGLSTLPTSLGKLANTCKFSTLPTFLLLLFFYFKHQKNTYASVTFLNELTGVG